VSLMRVPTLVRCLESSLRKPFGLYASTSTGADRGSVVGLDSDSVPESGRSSVRFGVDIAANPSPWSEDGQSDQGTQSIVGLGCVANPSPWSEDSQSDQGPTRHIVGLEFRLPPPPCHAQGRNASRFGLASAEGELLKSAGHIGVYNSSLCCADPVIVDLETKQLESAARDCPLDATTSVRQTCVDDDDDNDDINNNVVLDHPGTVSRLSADDLDEQFAHFDAAGIWEPLPMMSSRVNAPQRLAFCSLGQSAALHRKLAFCSPVPGLHVARVRNV
jgi:hypothetical protein